MSRSSTVAAIAALTGALALSQFFRSCLAVIAPELSQDLQLTPVTFGVLSSAFFLSFAAAQLPVGLAFDRWGVGRPTAALLALGVAGGLLFAWAPSGPAAMLAQAALGVACAPVFMGLIHYASEHLGELRFVRVVGVSNAIGMVGGLCAAAPLGWAAHAFGWRPSMLVATACMAAACLAVRRWVRDSGHADARAESPVAMLQASVALLKIRPLWTLIPLCLAMAAGTSLRTAWGGPYLAGVFQLDAVARGMAITVVSAAAIAAAFLLPMLARRWSLKTTIQGWTLLSLLTAVLLAAWPALALPLDLALLSIMCTVGTLHPILMAQGRGMLPPAMRGRGLGILNSFVFLGSALVATGFGWIAEWGQHYGLAPAATFGWIFLAAALLLVFGAVPYAFSPARPSPPQ
ncbi:MFS transporter [Xylophilus sp. GW821-FHT01B05]